MDDYSVIRSVVQNVLQSLRMQLAIIDHVFASECECYEKIAKDEKKKENHLTQTIYETML